MVEVHGNGHGDLHVVAEVAHDVGNGLEALLPLGGAGGALDDDGALELLGCGEDGTGPLKVVGVEGRHGVVALLGGLKHLCSIDKHG